MNRQDPIRRALAHQADTLVLTRPDIRDAKRAV